MADTTFKIGDLVTVAEEVARNEHRGVTYKVTKINRVNITVQRVGDQHGTGRPMTGHPSLFRPAAAPSTDASAPSATVTMVPYLPPLYCGTVITVSGPGWRGPVGEMYVVLKEYDDGKVRFARIGGDGGRYWTGIHRSRVTVVDPAQIAAALELVSAAV